MIKDWLNRLTSREQWLVLVMGAGLVVLIGYNALWQPLSTATQTLRDKNTYAHDTIEWMVQNKKAINSLGESGIASSDATGLSDILNQSISHRGLRMSRFQPGENNQAQVWLDDVVFDTLVLWLHDLEITYGLSILNLTINSRDTLGEVNVRLRIQQ